MTVVLAIRCKDGLVLAADSQITEGDRGMTYPGQKLHDLGPHAAWGGSGARSVLLDLEELFDTEASEIVGSGDVSRALQARVLPVLRHHYEHFIPDVPGEESAGTPSAYVLAAGYTDDQPWIVEVNPNAMVSRYEEIGFHAIGSGAAMAQQAGALLAHFHMRERPVDLGVLAAVRVLDSLARTSPSVGGPIDVARITADGAEHLDEDALGEVRAQVERWEEREHAILDDLLA